MDNYNIKSKNYNESFRLIKINDKEYLCWFNYRKDLFKQGKSLITVEDRDPNNCKSITKIIEIPFDGTKEKKEKYSFFEKNKKEMESFALWYYKNPTAYKQENFNFNQILK